MQKTSMKSNGSLPAKRNRLPAQIIERHKATVRIWQKNLSGDLVISNSEITVEKAFDEPKLLDLQKSQDRKTLIGLIVLQINDLLEFLGMEGKMKAKHIFDTAELILDTYGAFSLRNIQHCFNLVKRAEYPFNEELYNKVDGRKILKWLKRYDELILEDYIFGEAESKILHDKTRSMFRKKTLDDRLIDVAGAFGQLKSTLKQNGIAEISKQKANHKKHNNAKD